MQTSIYEIVGSNFKHI